MYQVMALNLGFYIFSYELRGLRIAWKHSLRVGCPSLNSEPEILGVFRELKSLPHPLAFSLWGAPPFPRLVDVGFGSLRSPNPNCKSFDGGEAGCQDPRGSR